MNSPKISIIVPVYKVEKYIRRCLDSIVAQTFTDWECILIDDGSPDNSGKICDEYAEKDGRFRVIHQENQGVAKARLNGFEQSKGELITFIDSDDYVSEDALQVMKDCLEEHNVDIAAFSYFDVVNEAKIKDVRTIKGYFNKDEIQKIQKDNILFDYNIGKAGLPFFLWTKLFTRTSLTDVLNSCFGFWYSEDAVCFFTALKKINSLFVSDKAIYYYVHHNEEATAKEFCIMWPAYEKIWSWYESYETDIAFKKQLANRIWAFCKNGLYRIAQKSKNYKQFITDTKIIRQSKFYINYVSNNKIVLRSKKDTMIYYLFENNHTILLWFLVKAKQTFDIFLQK